MVKKKTTEQKKSGAKKEAQGETLAEEVIENIPFVGGIFKSIKESPVFKERLKEVNKKLKERLQKGGSEKPVVEVGYRVGTIRGGTMRGQFGAVKTRAKPEPAPKVKKVEPGEAKKEHLVDILEEEESLRVVTEIPNVKEKDINVTVHEKTLTISAGKLKREVTLPCSVKAEIRKSYKNNILEIKLKKK